MRASLFLSPQEGGGCEPPSSLLEPVPVGGYCPYTPPPIPHYTLPPSGAPERRWLGSGPGGRTLHLSHCGSSHAGWQWEERLYAPGPGHGTRGLLRVAVRVPPGVGGARPDFVCFVSKERAPLVPHPTLCAPLRGCQGSSGRPVSRQEVPAKCATTRRRAWEPGGSAPLPGVQAVPWVPTGRLVPTAD